MLTRTHLTLTLFFTFVFFNFFSVRNKIIFVLVAVVATYIPDIDSKKSFLGKHIIFRPLQWFTKHRGIFHSFSFLIVAGFILFVLFPDYVLFGFAIGYASHLFADCLTIQGIQILYPLNGRISGFIKSGGIIETIIFVIFLLTDFGLFIKLFLAFFR